MEQETTGAPRQNIIFLVNISEDERISWHQWCCWGYNQHWLFDGTSTTVDTQDNLGCAIDEIVKVWIVNWNT
jgi:hypothetical protein